MKLIKCRKCGATVMTDSTLLSAMQDEYNATVKRSHYAKGLDKNICLQQLSHLSKMMTAVCHNSSQIEIRKLETYNELCELRRYIREHKLIEDETLSEIQLSARELTKKKVAEDEEAMERIYGDYENYFCNRTKADPTANGAIRKTK